MKFVVETGMRFEIFYALENLTAAGPVAVHAKWHAQAAARLPEAFYRGFRDIGGCATIWPVLADVLQSAPPHLAFAELLERFRQASCFQLAVLEGTLHSERLAHDLIEQRTTLRAALSQVPHAKQEWLAFIGLYPYQPKAPMVRALERVVKHPGAVQEAAAGLLQLFWDHVFEETWRELAPQLRVAATALERLQGALRFAAFCKEAGLRVIADEKWLRAVRGGYKLQLQEVRQGWLIPSAFNEKRYWTAYELEDGAHVFFPVFEPGITLLGDTAPRSEPELDVALIFRALGDTTRFAMASLIAVQPRSAVELAQVLAVSKPTVSHHVSMLREAGLIDEQFEAGSVRLSLRKPVLQKLSELALTQLYSATPDIKKTRRT